MELNCDLGEIIEHLENGLDAKFMALVDAVNIACTYHAGSLYQIEKTIELALEHNCNIGFHPSFNDRENFGRKVHFLEESQIQDLIFKQYEIFHKYTVEKGLKIAHMKPHGALYNLSAINESVAAAISKALLEIDKNIILYGLSGSQSILEAKKIGLNVKNEAFADRKYETDGTLVQRKKEGALLNDLTAISIQAKALFGKMPFNTISGDKIIVQAETICVHSDSPAGLEIAQLLYEIKHEK